MSRRAAVRPVVVGVDGSGHARRAAAWAAQEADLRSVPLLIVHVVEDAALAPEAPTILEKCAAVARIAAPTREPRTRTWFGEPAAELGLLGAGAELLVVGHHGSGRARPALGGTATRLARGHPEALAVVRSAPGRPLPDRSRPLVAAVDGRPGSAALVRHAGWLAALRGAVLDLVHVWHEHPRDIVERLGHQAACAHRQQAVQALQQAAEGARAAHPGLVVRPTVERGTPSRTLLELADDAQLIVIGRHRGAGVGLRAWTLLQAAACPVLVVDPALEDLADDGAVAPVTVPRSPAVVTGDRAPGEPGRPNRS